MGLPDHLPRFDSRNLGANNGSTISLRVYPGAIGDYRMFRRVLLLMVCGLLFAPCVYGQTLVPTIADFAYVTDSPSQKIDFWQAKSDKPTPVVLMIHGGSWKGGDKSEYNQRANITPLLDAAISVVTVNYRFINEAMKQNVEPPVKACLYDAARALQTVRSKAQEWNIEPERM